MIFIDEQSFLNNYVTVRTWAYCYESFLFQILFICLVSLTVDLKQIIFSVFIFFAYFLAGWKIGESESKSLRGGSSDKVQSWHDICQIDAHLEQIGSVAGNVPIILCEEQEGSLANLSLFLWINFATNELSLCLIEVVVCVSSDGGCEIANEYIPVDYQLQVSFWTNLFIPKDLVIIHPLIIIIFWTYVR